mmetsp:Transcript_20333/g.34910  ORF Transcript_20333/g.34910 Transcript_20333/m.34910 type:complete len:246 (-) Transcript_20333:245-982(-)|eukprot:CAMPEP_0119101960 /NCGR_PEP_ID=MMETSP1180-20130426/850_1 /TAXON_ID=3052 ORGANISM="Chlamydomonas cf sp, Strain CCMP681" /NCGR_SAMPLE_ID=MMETSP1180 /ASSEMBLY_ACC=CAM_ASM_000741 /LENGTH=245 /DNA_ID=CAMNT_0007086155 /DNA_START=158 /DNA_END=895 /DNA_ORIENTATION=+
MISLPSLTLAVLSVLTIAMAQPFEFQATRFAADISEPTQRTQDMNAGFTFNWNLAKETTTPNGGSIINQVDTNPFLSTLTGTGNGQAMFILGPCGSNTPHVHPRGAEISFMLYGSVQFGMIEENSKHNQLVLRNISANTTIHIPQGVLHFSHNPTCEPAAFLANFGTKDPGTQTIWSSLFNVPTSILQAASGLPESLIEQIKTYPFLEVPSTGGEECLKRCNLAFRSTNAFAAPPLMPDFGGCQH